MKAYAVVIQGPMFPIYHSFYLNKDKADEKAEKEKVRYGCEVSVQTIEIEE